MCRELEREYEKKFLNLVKWVVFSQIFGLGLIVFVLTFWSIVIAHVFALSMIARIDIMAYRYYKLGKSLRKKYPIACERFWRYTVGMPAALLPFIHAWVLFAAKHFIIMLMVFMGWI